MDSVTIRGGGRSSGRETIGRVAAGAIASKLLAEMGITIMALRQVDSDLLPFLHLNII